MTKTNLTTVQELSKTFTDIESVSKELKRVQSLKCRLKKQKGKATYESEMLEVLGQEQSLKELRAYYEPKAKFVTDYVQEDVDMLDYDQCIKAIKSIQSKKSNSKWLTEIENDNNEYRNAVRVEQLLLKRRDEIKPVDDSHVRKTDVQTIIDTLKESEIDKEQIIELLEKLI